MTKEEEFLRKTIKDEFTIHNLLSNDGYLECMRNTIGYRVFVLGKALSEFGREFLVVALMFFAAIPFFIGALIYYASKLIKIIGLLLMFKFDTAKTELELFTMIEQ